MTSKELIERTETRIFELMGAKKIDVPPDYSPGNALRSALLILKSLKNSKGVPILEGGCTKESIANALMYTIVQGLNPEKKQVYYITYGDTLKAQRSYFGSMALVQRLCNIVEIHSHVIYKDDIFDYSIDQMSSNIVIFKHKQELKNIDDKKIVGAYARLRFIDQRHDRVELMTINEIKNSWEQSKTYKKLGLNSTHEKFPAEMAKRTVIERACKQLINSSNDYAIMNSEATYVDNQIDENEYVEEEKKEKANSEEFKIEEIEEQPSLEDDDLELTDEEKELLKKSSDNNEARRLL